MTTVEMTYETYRSIMSENDDSERDKAYKDAETALLKAIQDSWMRAGVSWSHAVRSAAANVASYLAHIMNAYRGTSARPEDLVALIGRWTDQQPKGTFDAAAISRAKATFLQKLDADASLKTAVRNFWSARVSHDELQGMAGEDCLPEEIWYRQKKRNTSFADMDDIRQQIRLGVFHPNSIDQFSDKPLVPFQSDPFRTDCRQHLLSCGVRSEEIEFRWSYIDNRAMLEDLCMRRNRARDGLVDAIHSYKRVDGALREAVLRGVICLAWEAGMFYAHLNALGGLRFSISRDHISLFYREKFWDIVNAMDIRADEFHEVEDDGSSSDEEQGDRARGENVTFSVDILADLFIDITVCVVTHLVYSHHTENGELRLHDANIADRKIQEAIWRCIPVPRRTEKFVSKSADDADSGELLVMDAFVCAAIRPDANQFLVPVYADGRVVPSRAIDDRLALHQITIRRLAFRDAARDFFVDRILEELSPKWNMIIDTGSRRSEVLTWMISFGDDLMCERAYAMRNIFECIRARNYETARQIQAALHPALRMPPLAPCYPWAAEMDLVRPIIGRAPVPSYKDLDPAIDWSSLMALGGVQLPPDADAIGADGGDQTDAAPDAADDDDEVMDDRAPLDAIQEEEDEDVLDETAAEDMEGVVVQADEEEEVAEGQEAQVEEEEAAEDPAAEFVEVDADTNVNAGGDWVIDGDVADDELLNQL
jgi:hypothetical protein